MKTWIARRLAAWLTPYLEEHIRPTLLNMAYNQTIDREMIETLAESLGWEVTFDLQTGVVTLYPLKKD